MSLTHAQNFGNSTIAVSNLCCPVCWELLKILRNDDSSDLYVEDHHQTLFRVELPDWLPPGIVVKLTARFKKILWSQIKTLIRRDNSHLLNNQSSRRRYLCISSDSEEGKLDVVKMMLGYDPDFDDE